jgi:hypothetical protein
LGVKVPLAEGTAVSSVCETSTGSRPPKPLVTALGVPLAEL